MTTRVHGPALLVFLLALGASQVRAQAPRTGLWVGAGFGAGRFAMTCQWCGEEQVEDGGMGSLTLALAPSSRIRFAFELTGWFGTRGSVTERQASVLLLAQLFPVRSFPLFLEGGAGLDRVKLPFSASPGAPTLRSNGLGYRGGVGVDLPVNRDFTIVPRFTFSTASTAVMTLDGEALGEYESSSHLTGLSVGFLYRIPWP